MTKLTAIYPVLTVLVVASFLISCAAPAPAQTEIEKPSTPPDKLEIVYFHRANPCHCMAVVEGYIRQVVYLDFSSEEASGRLVYKSVVSDDPANKELVAKYHAYLFQLFFTEHRGKQERIYPVDQIWSLRDNPDMLKEFLRDIISKSLRGEI